MSLSQVQSALTKAFTDGNFFAKENTAFENIAFTPGASPWCELFFVPGEPSVSTLGDGGRDRYEGFLQINLNYPLNTGDKGPRDKYDALRNTFTAGRGFLYEGQEAKISNCGRSPGRNENGYFKVPVSVYFYAYVNR